MPPDTAQPTMAPPATTTTAAPLLEIAGLGHRFGRTTVLEGVSLAVAPGEMLALVGPSGCGKSTLLRLVAGLERLQAGAIRIDGETVAAAGHHVLPERRGVGMVFQDFALFPHMPLLDNVAFGLGGHARAERSRIAHAMLDSVGLAARAGDYPHALSGGQQQRVALARALAPQPRLVLLDEPFSNLDMRLRHQMRLDTMRLLRESRAASILVTHDPEEAMFMADRIALMHEGRLVQVGSPNALYHQPVNASAAGFFGEVNRFCATVAAGRVATPFGNFDAGHLAEGTRALVLLRCGAIRLCAPGPGAIAARLLTSRSLGAQSALRLQLAQGTPGSCELHAQVTSPTACEEGAEVFVGIDARGVFVFPEPLQPATAATRG